MATGLLDLHNILRWVILILLLLATVKAFTGWQQKRMFSAGDRRIWLFTLITNHLNLLLGLYLLFFGRYGILTTPAPAEGVMKNGFFRFFWVEHPLQMILSVIFITLANGMGKKAVPDVVKYRKAFWFFLIALLLILAAIPWPFRAIGRPLLPGM